MWIKVIVFLAGALSGSFFLLGGCPYIGLALMFGGTAIVTWMESRK